MREAGAAPSDPAYADQWALPKIGWDNVFGSLAPSGTAKLAVLDTGVSSAGGDLNVGAGWSAFGTDPADRPERARHGGGIDRRRDRRQRARASPASPSPSTTIQPVQVLDATASGQDSDIIEGVVWAADHGADVILMSFSNPGYSPALQDAIDYAWDAGRRHRRRDRQRRRLDADVPGRRREGRRRLGDDPGRRAVERLATTAPTRSSAPRASAIRPTRPTARRRRSPAPRPRPRSSQERRRCSKANDASATNGVIVGRLARNADAGRHGRADRQRTPEPRARDRGHLDRRGRACGRGAGRRRWAARRAVHDRCS